MIKKSLLMSLIAYNLIGCSSIELIHSPVGCLGSPQITLGFTQEEVDTISNEAKKKLVVFVKTLRKRIDTQCEINKAHDKQYEDE